MYSWIVENSNCRIGILGPLHGEELNSCYAPNLEYLLHFQQLFDLEKKNCYWFSFWVLSISQSGSLLADVLFICACSFYCFWKKHILINTYIFSYLMPNDCWHNLVAGSLSCHRCAHRCAHFDRPIGRNAGRKAYAIALAQDPRGMSV